MLYAYSYEAYDEARRPPYNSPATWTTWASTDTGISWQQYNYRFGGSILSYAVASADARVVYLLAKDDAMRPDVRWVYPLYASTDAGRTWEKRSGIIPPADYNDALYKYIQTVPGATTPVNFVQVFFHTGIHPYVPIEVRLSADGGRTFQLLGLDDRYLDWDLRRVCKVRCAYLSDENLENFNSSYSWTN